MTFEEVRQTIFTVIEGISTLLYARERVVFPNQSKINMAKQAHDPFVMVRVDYVKSNQISLGILPPARYTGVLYMSYYSATGSGSKSHTEFYDLMVNIFQTKSIGSVVFGVIKPTNMVTIKDWASTMVMIPFHFDKLN